MLAFVSLLAGTSQAQFTKGSWELSLTGGLNSLSLSRSGSSSSTSSTVLDVNISPGYYFIDGLSFEPEIGMFADLSSGSNSKAYLKFVGNVSYTFYSADKSFAPYVKAGIGTSNGIEIFFSGLQGALPETLSDSYSSVTILNAGLGMKFLVAKSAAVRTELNYRKQSYSYTGSSGGSLDYSYANIGFMFGVSLVIL